MEKNKLIRILYLPSAVEGGVFYYRCLTPMTQLKKMYPNKYEVYITNNIAVAWKRLSMSNILIVHNCLYDMDLQFRIWNLVTEAKKIGVKTVLDMDDYWNYGEQHPLYQLSVQGKYHIKSAVNLNLFDAVTTTTERLKQTLEEYGKNVFVMENGISRDDSQFSVKKSLSDRIRFGITGGASHITDIKQMFGEDGGIFDFIGEKMRDKIQIVLCGFNTNGKKVTFDENGNKTETELNPEEVWWAQLERQITKDYSIVSEAYKEVLLKYDEKAEEEYFSGLRANGITVFDEPYRRVWSRSIQDFEYGKIYEDIDVLMVPLTNTVFNSKKSELKFVEGGFTDTAVITSKVAPYTDYGTDELNCLFVDDMTPKGWAEKIVYAVKHPEKMEKIAENMRNKVLQERDLEAITKKRNIFFTKLVNGKIL